MALQDLLGPTRKLKIIKKKQELIGLLRFGAEGTFVYDFDTSLMRNPNGNNGLLQAITTTTASTEIDCIGHDILYSQ